MVPAIIGDNVVLFMVLFFNEIGNSSIQVYFLKFLKYKIVYSTLKLEQESFNHFLTSYV
jgi:hypothetical protein